MWEHCLVDMGRAERVVQRSSCAFSRQKHGSEEKGQGLGRRKGGQRAEEATAVPAELLQHWEKPEEPRRGGSGAHRAQGHGKRPGRRTSEVWARSPRSRALRNSTAQANGMSRAGK